MDREKERKPMTERQKKAFKKEHKLGKLIERERLPMMTTIDKKIYDREERKLKKEIRDELKKHGGDMSEEKTLEIFGSTVANRDILQPVPTLPRYRGGRKKKFATPEVLQQAVDLYFEDDKYPTMMGLARYLNMTHRGLLNYNKVDEFKDILDEAKLHIIDHVEKRLIYGKGSAQGLIFWLKCNSPMTELEPTPVRPIINIDVDGLNDISKLKQIERAIQGVQILPLNKNARHIDAAKAQGTTVDDMARREERSIKTAIRKRRAAEAAQAIDGEVVD